PSLRSVPYAAGGRGQETSRRGPVTLGARAKMIGPRTRRGAGAHSRLPPPFGSSCRHARPWWIRGVAGSVPGGELAGRDVELRAPVPRPGALVAGGVQRPGLAEALRLEARLVEAEAHEELLGRVRPAEAQRDVVLDRAALVRVPVDPQLQRRVRTQDRNLGLQDRARVPTDVR